MICSPSGAAQWKAPHNVDNLWTNEKQPNGLGAVDCSMTKYITVILSGIRGKSNENSR